MSNNVRSFFGRIYGAAICLQFYLTFKKVLLKHIYANSQYFWCQNWFLVKLLNWKEFWFDFMKILTPFWFFSKTWTLSPPTKDASQRKTRKKKSRILYCDIYKFTYYIFLFLLTTYCWNKLAFFNVQYLCNNHFLSYILSF